MTVQNRISVSFNNEEFETLERLSSHTQKTKAELIRLIVEEFLHNNPDRFRLKTDVAVKRKRNIVFADVRNKRPHRLKT